MLFFWGYTTYILGTCSAWCMTVADSLVLFIMYCIYVCTVVTFVDEYLIKQNILCHLMFVLNSKWKLTLWINVIDHRNLGKDVSLCLVHTLCYGNSDCIARYHHRQQKSVNEQMPKDMQTNCIYNQHKQSFLLALNCYNQISKFGSMQ